MEKRTFLPHEPRPEPPKSRADPTSRLRLAFLSLRLLRARSFCLPSASGLAAWRALVFPIGMSSNPR